MTCERYHCEITEEACRLRSFRYPEKCKKCDNATKPLRSYFKKSTKSARRMPIPFHITN